MLGVSKRVSGYLPVTNGSDSMGREINIDRIRDLGKQIEEGAGDIIKLKRVRNSLLNISTIVPPEILGSIFRWNVIPDSGLPPFGSLPKGTYNFLFVCHHWFEVASHTPELWSFWGNTMRKWSRWYKRSGTTPVDLVLSGYTIGGSKTLFDGSLRDTLRDRVACDAIRSLHLLCKKRSLLTSILSILTPDDEDIRSSSIESITLRYVDASKLFARYRFPKSWYLDLSTGVTISSLEDLGSCTTALTTLSLTTKDISCVPTTPQLLSILASNPRLQSLTLSKYMIPRDDGDGSTVLVPLRHLKKLSLTGHFHPVFQLLDRLDHPEMMDEIKLTVSRCTVGNIMGTLGSYVQDYIQRDGRFRDGLGIHVTSLNGFVSIQASTISSVTGPVQKVKFATFTAIHREDLSVSADGLCTGFVAYTPREHVVYFGGNLGINALRRTVVAMPKLQELHLLSPMLDHRFLQPDSGGPLANEKLFPSLQHLHLEDTFLSEDDWSPIIPYLTHQTSGGQRISLTISGDPQHICRDVLREMEGLVEELVLNLTLEDDCPIDYCSISEREE